MEHEFDREDKKKLGITTNDKQILINRDTSILKSNELSLAKLSHGLSQNQTQLLHFAIFTMQKNGETVFHKSDFEKKVNFGKYNTKYVKNDIRKLRGLYYTLDRLEKDNIYREFNAFQDITYNKGVFEFVWTETIKPHILQLKEKFVLTDLTITANFKSAHSWVLYDFLRGYYSHWYMDISKDSLMQTFGVGTKKSYVDNTALFKKKVLDVAVEEINQYTELIVRYEEKKVGKTIVGFKIYWTIGGRVNKITEQQLSELKSIYNSIFQSEFDDEYRYILLSDENLKERAAKIMRKLKANRKIIDSTAETFTKDYADNLISDSKNFVHELEFLMEQDKKIKEEKAIANAENKTVVKELLSDPFNLLNKVNKRFKSTDNE